MKFVCRVQYADGSGEPWEESYDKPTMRTLAEAEAWAEITIANFNNTLRPNEVARKILNVTVVSEKSDAHDWEKQNLVTEIDRRGLPLDRLKCRNCGITAKRIGLEGFQMGTRYRAKKYLSCAKAQERKVQ